MREMKSVETNWTRRICLIYTRVGLLWIRVHLSILSVTSSQ